MRARWSVRDAGLVGAAGVAMGLLFLVVRGSLNDDAYITLAYAKNLALHLHWGLIPDEVANTATSPLNTLLLAAGAAVTRLGHGAHPVLALGAVSVGLVMLTAWGWTRVVRALGLPFGAAAVGVAVVLFNPFLMSAIGLEVLLIPTVLILMLAAALEGRPGWFGVVAGLAVLARLDLVLFALLMAGASPAVRAGWRRAAAAMAAVALPWFVFSWIYLGSVVPDTLVLKLSQYRILGHWTYLDGPGLYLKGLPLEVTLAFLPGVLGVAVLVAWAIGRKSWPELGPAAAVAGGGIAYYAIYSALKITPYHWYYVAPLASLSIWLVIAAGAAMRSGRAPARLSQVGGPAVLGVAAALALANLAVDLAQGVPWKSPVIFGNWASAHDYARVGMALHRRVGGAAVDSPGEVGTLAFFCNCAIVDEFSDRGSAIAVVNAKLRSKGPLTRALLRLNYAWTDLNRRPRPVAYRLLYAPVPGAGPNVWQVWSAARGIGHFTLARAGP